MAEHLRLLDWRSILVLLSLGSISWYYIRAKKTPRLPPGPRGLPCVGNIFEFPRNKPWLKFGELADIWGDIFLLTVLGNPWIIISSVEVAEDLLDTHGAAFSDRPKLQLGGELAGFNNALPLVARYNDRVRDERKLYHQLFGTRPAINQFIPLLATEVHEMLRNILLNPDGAIDEIRRTAEGITLRIAYGYHPVGDSPDPLVQKIATAGRDFLRLTTPGASLVDIIPILRYWPEWLPGGGFHTTAKMVSKHTADTVNTGLEYVKKEMAAGTAVPSFVSNLLEEKRHDEYLIKWAAATIELGGSDTTAASLEAAVLAMTLFPDVQAAAQRELDQVVGSDRLPNISDRAQLPYLDALCKEVIRWHTALPFGKAILCVFRCPGLEPLLIPKNSWFIVNLWKIAHDPELYADPMVFNPTRFIPQDGRAAEHDPGKISFGYGRRICPGRFYAQTSLFLQCSAILSVFKFSKARENGVVLEPQLGHTAEVVSRVLPFKFVVEPRNARALALIQGN
ncbi:cytochrome P450 [Mycena galopus ATCC 62051]|nr:cytochrome P450 [Mycena galopus ATCC 62051]